MKQVSVINENDIEQFTFASVKVRELFKTDDPSISVAEINLSGENDKNKNTGSDMFYYVIEGNGRFIINDKEYAVKKGSLVFIPKGASYQDIGELKMISLAIPKFDQKNVVFLNGK